MRVLVFTNIFPSSREPTRGIYTYYRINELALHCDVEVVCPVPVQSRVKTPRKLVFAPTEQHGRLRTTYPSFFPISRFSPRLNPWLMYQTTLPTVREIHKRFPFDIVLASWGYPDAGAALLHARRYSCPQVTQLIGSDLNISGRDPRFRPLVAEVLRASAHVLTMSAAMAREVVGMGVSASRVSVRHNGVDQGKFCVRDPKELRVKYGLPSEVPIVLYTGNLARVKAPEVLVEAFGSVARLPSRPQLVVVGDGEMRSELEQTVAAKDLGSSIRFVGRRPHTEIPEWMGAADVLCLPSRAEGCPNVVLEAFSSGRPVVATAVGAVPELVTPDRGRVVDVGNVSALAQALEDVLSRTWDAETIRNSVADMSWAAVGRAYHEVLQTALEEARNK